MICTLLLCLTPAGNPVADYRRVDLEAVLAQADDGPAAAAVAALARNDADAAGLLEAAAEAADDPTPLARLLVRRLQTERRWADAVSAAARYGVPDALAGEAPAFAKFPPAAAEGDSATVPHSGLTFAAVAAGPDGTTAEVSVIFDSGAPGVGLNDTLVEKLGLTVDRSVSRRSVVPAFGLDFPVYPVLLNELRIGGLTLKNLPCNTGEVPDDQRAAADRLRQMTGGAEVILGLDAFEGVAERVAIDYTAGTIAFLREPDGATAPPNYVRAGGGKPAARFGFGPRTVPLYIDTGSYGHILPNDVIDAAAPVKVRTYEQPWATFSERLATARLPDGSPADLWLGGGDFGADADWGVVGVFGNPRNGTLTLDLAGRRVTLEGYDPAKAVYGFEPKSAETIDPED